jgi:hypothetical protein
VRQERGVFRTQLLPKNRKEPWTERPQSDAVTSNSFYKLIQHILENSRQSLCNNGFAINEAMTKSSFLDSFPTRPIQTVPLYLSLWHVIYAGTNTALPIQLISEKIFITNTNYFVACRLLWKLHAGKYVSGDYISSDVSNVGDKWSVTTNISRIIDLTVRFPSEINLFPRNNFDHSTYQ